MSVSFKVDDVSISAVRDRAMFNTFAGNQSYVIAGVGNELQVNYSSSSFIVQLDTGEAVISGGSMVSEGTLDTITLGANESGYLVVRIDLSQTGDNICRFYSTPTIVQENINDGVGLIYDLPLYNYQTSSSGVQNLNDIRSIKSSLLGGATFSVEGNDVFVIYKDSGGDVVKKKLGSLDPATLTATQSDVLSGKLFGGANSDTALTGTMTNKSNSSSTAVVELSGANIRMKIPTNAYYNTNSYLTRSASDFGNARTSDVLSGKRFTSSNGLNIEGNFTLQTKSVIDQVANGTLYFILDLSAVRSVYNLSVGIAHYKASGTPSSTDYDIRYGDTTPTSTYSSSWGTRLQNGTLAHDSEVTWNWQNISARYIAVYSSNSNRGAGYIVASY